MLVSVNFECEVLFYLQPVDERDCDQILSSYLV